MTEIPADVMKQAQEIAGPDCKCVDGCGLCKKERIETIARAIFAERERCAKIAERNITAAGIAIAIREGDA